MRVIDAPPGWADSAAISGLPAADYSAERGVDWETVARWSAVHLRLERGWVRLAAELWREFSKVSIRSCRRIFITFVVTMREGACHPKVALTLENAPVYSSMN